MFVYQRLVPMRMVVLGAFRYRNVMLVLVVLVVSVFMVMPRCFVSMFVFMIFNQVQPGA
jgi:hypothetical protein